MGFCPLIRNGYLMTNGPTDRQTNWHTNRPAGQQTDGPTERRINRTTDQQTDRQTDQQMDRRTNRPTNQQTPQTNRPTDELANRRTDRQRLVCVTYRVRVWQDCFRGYARAYIKDVEKIRATAIIDIIHSGEQVDRSETKLQAHK